MNLDGFQIITSQIIEVIAKCHATRRPSVHLPCLVCGPLDHEGNAKCSLEFRDHGVGWTFARFCCFNDVHRFSHPFCQILLTPIPASTGLGNALMKIISQLFAWPRHDVVFLSPWRWRSGDGPSPLKPWGFALWSKIHLVNATVASGDLCLSSTDAFHRHFNGST